MRLIVQKLQCRKLQLTLTPDCLLSTTIRNLFGVSLLSWTGWKRPRLSSWSSRRSCITSSHPAPSTDVTAGPGAEVSLYNTVKSHCWRHQINGQQFPAGYRGANVTICLSSKHQPVNQLTDIIYS